MMGGELVAIDGSWYRSRRLFWVQELLHRILNGRTLVEARLRLKDFRVHQTRPYASYEQPWPRRTRGAWSRHHLGPLFTFRCDLPEKT